jgi:hypothetical protein
VAGSNTCQTTCDVSRGIDDRDRPSEGQVSIKASAYRTSIERSKVSSRRYRDRPFEGQVLEIRRSGDPGHKGLVHLEIVIREIPISGEQLSAQQRRRTED